MYIFIDERVKAAFPELKVLPIIMEGLNIKSEDQELELVKSNILREIKSKYSIESLKDVPSVRAYREFFWRIGIDPTKNRPAAEALIRRALLGNPPPKINTFVDSLNLASIKSEVAIGSFDLDKISGEAIVMRYASRGETFHGIGMVKPSSLNGSEIVLADGAGLIAIYPHRDSERTKIAERTSRALLLFCGVPGIGEGMLQEAMNTAINLISRFCSGSARPIEVR